MDQAFPFRFCILQNWTVGRPGNELGHPGSIEVATGIHTKLSVFIGYEYYNVLIRPKPISVSFALWVYKQSWAPLG